MNNKLLVTIICAIIFGVVIWSIVQNANDTPAAMGTSDNEPEETVEISYGKIKTTYRSNGDTVTVAHEDETYELNRAVSASGARYANSDETVVFWEHQGEATLEIAGEVVASGSAETDVAAEKSEQGDTAAEGTQNPTFQDNEMGGDMVETTEQITEQDSYGMSDGDDNGPPPYLIIILKDVKVTFGDNDNATLEYEGEAYELVRVPTDTGARYVSADGAVVFTEIEGEGSLEIDGVVVESGPTKKQGDPDANKYDFVGMSEAEAEAQAAEKGVMFRVVERDGEMLPTSRDYREGRINAVVETGVVTSYTIEGSEQGTESSSHDAIIGMTAAEAEVYAEANDVSFRIGFLDGEPQALTMDYRPGRITAAIEDGVVASYTVE
jgi:membrane-bound inhibitor of C-type lysozyme